MSFLHPWALMVGIAGAGLPLAIHFLVRRRSAKTRWRAENLRECTDQSRISHRLRDVTLLAARTLAVLLLAMVVAQSQWKADRAAEQDAGDQTVRAVSLDTSQSMAAVEGGTQTIEGAAAVAGKFLGYRPGPEESRINTTPGNGMQNRLTTDREPCFCRPGRQESARKLWTWFAVACLLSVMVEIAALTGSRT